MASVNTGGLTVPDDTDAVNQGAAAMRTMASKLAAMASGTVGLALPGSPGTSNSVAVTFPVGRFTVAPVITLMRQTAWNPGTGMAYYANGITTSGFTLNGQSTSSGGTATLHWIAVQPA